MKPITHRPKVGDILECDFGEWAIPISFDGHIKPEMRKRRLVVILNGNLDGGACIVVPISSSDADALGFSAAARGGRAEWGFRAGAAAGGRRQRRG